MGRLDGKVAVITGASSGIGLRTAEMFVAAGAKIVVADLRAPEGEAVAKRLGPNCIFHKTDVTVEEQVKAMIARAVDEFGRIDCLFNNAGSPGQNGGIENVEVERFDLTMAILVRSVVLGMKHAAPYMKRQGSGSIINTGSAAGRWGGISSSIAYSTAKAAVIHLTKCVALELGEAGVRVNSITPGYIATPIGWPAELAANAPAMMQEMFKNEQAILRTGLPEDIAYAALFLASDESTYVSGHDLAVDGALTAGRSWSLQQQYQQRRNELLKAFEAKAG